MITRRSHPPACKNGFTVFETIMVISIVSILALYAYPLLTAPSQFPLDAAANVVESDIRLTQIGAMTKGARRTVIFAGGSGEYVYNNDSDAASGLTRDLKEIGGSITIGSDLIIAFNSRGEPIGQRAMIVIIKTRGKERRVIVEPYTGITKTE